MTPTPIGVVVAMASPALAAQAWTWHASGAHLFWFMPWADPVLGLPPIAQLVAPWTNGLAWLLAWALVLSLAGQTLLTGWFVRRVGLLLRQRRQWPAEPEGGWPEAEVVLCLRGADASLAPALAALAHQTYPGRWRLQLVVDSQADPAWALAQSTLAALEAQASWQAAQMATLAQRPQRGSLKSASLRQAFAHLHPATALVALVDADAIVSPDWLTDLARACSQPGIGAVSGNRWYQPQGPSLAGRVRAGWNGGALVLMTLLAIPWGGSLAVRRQVIDGGAWSERLLTSLCEDTSLIQPLRQLGWRYAFRPELIALDQDDSMPLAELAPWIGRQLLTARLHHPAWPLVALHGVGSALVLGAVCVLLLVGRSPALAGALGLYELGCMGLLLWIEATALAALAKPEYEARRRPGAPLWRRAWGWLRDLPATQLIYAVAVWHACWDRQVSWRGVTYRVIGPRQPGGPGVAAMGWDN